ncbi:MAG TPA: hypothetical protein VFH23_03345 [Jiangellaceae bacterium]|nr:hypothetical protein [Jiangellaceae bacterium]
MASGALPAVLASHGVDEADAVDLVLAGFAEPPAHLDVSPGLHPIHAAGIRLVTLTNGATAISDRMLDGAGVLPLLEHRLSVEVPKRWKPHPDASVCRRSLRRRAGCAGAGRGPSLGCRRCSPRRTDWRLGRPPQDAVPARVPTARPPGPDLETLADMLTA